MLPKKKKRGYCALARLKTFDGCPAPYDKKKKLIVPDALRILNLRSYRKYSNLGKICSQLGWKHGGLIEGLEEKRKEVETAELEIKEMKFEHAQIIKKLEIANKHVERVEADLADERKSLEEAVNKTTSAEDKATARDVIVADLEKTIAGAEENLTKLGFHLDEVSVREEGQKREARRFTQIEKESEKELLVMLGEAENAGDKVSAAEQRLEAELAEAQHEVSAARAKASQRLDEVREEVEVDGEVTVPEVSQVIHTREVRLTPEGLPEKPMSPEQRRTLR